MGDGSRARPEAETRGGGDSQKREHDPQAKRYGIISENQMMRTCREGDSTHCPIRSEDLPRSIVDGDRPAGVVEVGDDDEAGGAEHGGQLDALGLVAGHGHDFGRVRSFMGEKRIDVFRSVGLDPGDAPRVADRNSRQLPELIRLIEKFLHQLAPVSQSQAVDWRNDVGPMDHPCARERGIIAKNPEIVRCPPNRPTLLASRSVERANSRVDKRGMR